jgi:hypothetical protein
MIMCVCVCVWYPQSKEILLNLSMKCWNAAFNAQGLRVIIVVVQVGVVSRIYVAASKPSSGGAQETGWNSVYHQNWWKSWFASQFFSFVKFSFPVTHLMAYYAETGCSRPLSRLTLQITLFYSECCGKP